MVASKNVFYAFTSLLTFLQYPEKNSVQVPSLSECCNVVVCCLLSAGSEQLTPGYGRPLRLVRKLFDKSMKLRIGEIRNTMNDEYF